MNRINPYPPSFNSTAAKIMDPSRGASTWALGNQRWVKNIGIFTKNVTINTIGSLILKHKLNSVIIFVLLINIIPIRRGREAKIV